jgi:hypothetical protein
MGLVQIVCHLSAPELLYLLLLTNLPAPTRVHVPYQFLAIMFSPCFGTGWEHNRWRTAAAPALNLTEYHAKKFTNRFGEPQEQVPFREQYLRQARENES